MVSSWADLVPLFEKAKKRGSQKRVALQLGLTESTLSNYLSGKTTPDPVLGLRIASAFGINIEAEAGLEAFKATRNDAIALELRGVLNEAQHLLSRTLKVVEAIPLELRTRTLSAGKTPGLVGWKEVVWGPEIQKELEQLGPDHPKLKELVEIVRTLPPETFAEKKR